jgi:hypothetical protein
MQHTITTFNRKLYSIRDPRATLPLLAPLLFPYPRSYSVFTLIEFIHLKFYKAVGGSVLPKT